MNVVKKIAAVTACPTGIAHSIMAAEALKKTAAILGYSIQVEMQTAEGVKSPLTESDISTADLIIVASDIHVDLSRFAGKPLVATTTSRAIRSTRAVIEEAIAESFPQSGIPAVIPETSTAELRGVAESVKHIVGVTACPTGIAHTFMAAEALRKSAIQMGYEIQIETQGSVGAKNHLTPDAIAKADAVIVAADTYVDLSRFAGKRLYQTSTKNALKSAKTVIEESLTAPVSSAVSSPARETRAEKKKGPGVYKHLLTGVSYMLPVIVAGGLIIAISFLFGINPLAGTFGDALMQIGGKAAFALIVPVLSGFIAFSIADRPGLAPGLIGGMLAANLGMGFFGGIVSGFLAGYCSLWIREKIKLPVSFEGLKPVLVIPLLSTLIVGLLLIYVFGVPVRALMTGLTSFLQGMGRANAVLFGLILGGMMAVDMGGPVNKAAYTFAVGLLASNVYQPMAAVMAAGMTPPLGLGLSTLVARKKFSQEERQAGKVATVLGLSFVTEGVIPFAAKDPVRIIPACVIGSALTGSLSMWFDCTLRAPHGGLFTMLIPNAVGKPLHYAAAIVAGSIVTAIAVVLLRRRAT